MSRVEDATQLLALGSQKCIGKAGYGGIILVSRHCNCHHDWSNTAANGPKLLVYITDTWPYGAVFVINGSGETTLNRHVGYGRDNSTVYNSIRYTK